MQWINLYEAVEAKRAAVMNLAASIPAPEVAPRHQDEGPRVVLRSPSERPSVCGEEKDRLTLAQYEVVQALLAAGERGLSKDELDRKSKRGDARKVLKRLAESDPDWKAVIHFPGKPGRGYRIG
jgi:hypothetical protein